MLAVGTRRTTLAVMACELIPVPLVDTVVQNEIRRTWIRWLAAKQGVVLPMGRVSELADQPLLPLKRALLWPLLLVLKKVFPPLVLWGIWTVGRDTWKLGTALSPGLDGFERQAGPDQQTS